jgi:hypothetical protein
MQTLTSHYTLGTPGQRVISYQWNTLGSVDAPARACKGMPCDRTSPTSFQDKADAPWALSVTRGCSCNDHLQGMGYSDRIQSSPSYLDFFFDLGWYPEVRWTWGTRRLTKVIIAGWAAWTLVLMSADGVLRTAFFSPAAWNMQPYALPVAPWRLRLPPSPAGFYSCRALSGAQSCCAGRFSLRSGNGSWALRFKTRRVWEGDSSSSWFHRVDDC